MSVNKVDKTTGNTTLIAGSTLWADSPIGTILAYGGATAPSGWMLCQGQAISRTTYSELFAVIGTSFGTGDGSTTFNLPDLRNKTTMGGGTLGAESGGSLPNIKGDSGAIGRITGVKNGPITNGALRVQAYSGGETGLAKGDTNSDWKTACPFDIDASRSSNLYKNNQSYVEPANVRVNYIIKAKMVAMPSDFMSKVDEAVGDLGVLKDTDLVNSVTSGSTAPITSGGVYSELYNQTATKKVVTSNRTVVNGTTEYANNVGRIQGHNAISTVKNPTTGKQWPVTNSNSNDTFVALEDVQIYVDKANYKIYMRAANSTDMGAWFALN